MVDEQTQQRLNALEQRVAVAERKARRAVDLSYAVVLLLVIAIATWLFGAWAWIAAFAGFFVLFVIRAHQAAREAAPPPAD